ncbi:MAG: CopG family ribbon-helix-helix protein [Gammaproteobacteria bacterium]
MTTTTLSLRIDEDLREQLARLADATDRPMNYHATAALEAYLAVQEWQVQGTREALAEAEKDNPRAEQTKVREWVESWDTDTEAKPPL